MGQSDEPNRPKMFVPEELHDIELFLFMNSGISDFLRNRYAFLNKVQPDSLSIFWIFNKEGSRLNLNQ